MATKISKTEQQWRAESDAHTLAEYQKIINDPSRFKRATSAAAKQEREYREKADALKGISRIKPSSRRK